MPAPRHSPTATKEIRRAVRRLRTGIGERLQAQRRRRRMTLSALSRLTGLPVGTLDRYELGRDDITLLALAQLARALGVTVEDLLMVYLPADAVPSPPRGEG